MNNRWVPATAFGLVAGTLTYLLAGVPALALTSLANPEQARTHRDLLFQYWLQPPWIAAAAALAIAAFSLTLLDGRGEFARWSRWAIWGLIPPGLYVGTVAILSAVAAQGDQPLHAAAYVTAYTFVDGSLWIALLSPVTARLVITPVRRKANLHATPIAHRRARSDDASVEDWD